MYLENNLYLLYSVTLTKISRMLFLFVCFSLVCFGLVWFLFVAPLLEVLHLPRQYVEKNPLMYHPWIKDASDIKLIGTDNTHDLIQKSEKQ